MRFEVSTVTLNEAGTDGAENDLENTYGYESCGVRLTTVSINEDDSDELTPKMKVKQQKDVFLYRMGYYNYQKINMENMVHQYEG